MKKLMMIAFLGLFTSSVFAQNVDTRRKIEVTGSAEAEVTPDIIYLAISLKEYFKDNSNKKLIEIEELENQLREAVLKAGIPKENFTIKNVSSYNYSFEKKKKPNYIAKKQYLVLIKDLTAYNAILNAIDPKGIESTTIERYEYSKIESLRMELKIMALRASKDKAISLAAVLNDKIGDALDVQEINNENYPQPIYSNARFMDKSGGPEETESPDFKKINLKYQMKVVYQLTK